MAWSLVAVAAGLLAVSTRAGTAAEPQVQVVARRLDVPWALAFAPDGRLFVTERPGRIRVVRDGRLDPAPVATLPVAVDGEAGLLGLALHPAFAENGHLHVCYTAHGDRPGQRSLVNRVVRLTLGTGGVLGGQVILDGIPGGSNHDGCRLKFGPDGRLYLTTGDAGQQRLAQRLDSLAGKILRLNADGTIPADNPFRGSPVYSLGHRNPQGLAWDRSGRLFAAEHGPTGHDEVNRIEAGRNYGWPDVTGKGRNSRYVGPLIESGDDTWAPSGIAIHGDDLFVAGLRGRRLLRIVLGSDGQSARMAPPVLQGFGRLRDVVVGPDGALFVTTSNRDGRGSPDPDDDRILRVVPESDDRTRVR